MEPTREQLQAEILEILYQKCLQKPIWVSCAEIFWSISNLKVSERSVKDVLDWLVKNDLVIYQADKYQIAKREFMDISRRKALEKKETEENAEVRTVEYGTSIPPHTMNHHPWLEREYQQPVAKSSNTMFAIIDSKKAAKTVYDELSKVRGNPEAIKETLGSLGEIFSGTGFK